MLRASLSLERELRVGGVWYRQSGTGKVGLTPRMANSARATQVHPSADLFVEKRQRIVLNTPLKDLEPNFMAWFGPLLSSQIIGEHRFEAVVVPSIMAIGR